jgi:predicted O-methyltransferase YrrM
VKFEQVYDQVGRFALMSPEKAAALYAFVLSEGPEEIFELGSYRGGSALIMAAALSELGRGRVSTFDFPEATKLKPNIQELLQRTGLQSHVAFVPCEWCCEWELAKVIEAQLSGGGLVPYLDFAYIDGGHFWTATGFAFYLVTNLLKPGAWILFDDLDWIIERDESPKMKYVQMIPPGAKRRPMVQMVYDLLVKTHPGYENFKTTFDGTWGWAQRRPLVT